MTPVVNAPLRLPKMPLRGMRVCEISHHLSGPLCGLYLAEYGADVVRLEHPAGDRLRRVFAEGHEYGAPFAATNRGKRIVRADLRTEEGLRVAKRLISGCDVVVTNFRPDTLLKLGLGPDAVQAINSTAIYLSLSSCGWEDGFRTVGMDDGAAQAASGLAHATGWSNDEPILAPIPIGATVSALFGAIVATAAWARGVSTSVDCALVDSLATCLEFPLMKAATFGEVPARNGGRHPSSSPSQPFRTKDGFLAIMAASETDFDKLMTALELRDLPKNSHFNTYAARLRNRDMLEKQIEVVLKTNDTGFWFERLSALGIACAPLQTLDEAIETAKTQDFGTIHPLPYGNSQCDIVAIPGGRAARGFGNAKGPSDIATPGWSRRSGAALKQPTCKVLDGVRVLDLTRFLSGPFATLILSDLGANVLKVEPPGGDPARRFSPFLGEKSGYFASVNRGKNTVTVDLKEPDGRIRILEEVERADILVDNYRPGVMDRLGLTQKALEERNPNLVRVSISGYGSDRPFSNRAAFDMTMQAFTGIMHQTGHSVRDYTRLGFSAGDITTGLFAAFGVVAELASVRRKVDRAATLEIPMFDSLMAILEPLIVRQSVGHPAVIKAGGRHSGGTPIGMFACADGYIYLSAADDKSFAKLTQILKMNDTHKKFVALDKLARQNASAEIDAAIEQACKEWRIETLCAELEAAGILYSPVLDPLSAVQSPLFRDRNLFEDWDGFRLIRTPFRDISKTIGERR